ncbi:hypothetical protein IE81DRAFT_291310 [Ceraceosorus guamensis]|uniref:CDP-diacylglycerol--glycerol-3-phosphate 3-phosphatidyltransferase n=1 Tax=Ceraceosorus guamensis TaxID=1522189 RepID=A0A316W2A8_9BASI|nr:hypothetical protein IE81DRAFT_291310 [Ceraceosorus guamensis]PWN41815.1 hypothetical protein IE81DRAFT_291310 [Ceraceosorus guamensis]
MDSTSTPASSSPAPALSEDILTLPNVLTILRLASTPLLGYLVVQGHMEHACVLLFVSGLTDVLDGWIARARGSYTVFGSIADPAADKALMTVMVLALAYRGLLPASLVALILGRDIALVISAFFVRYRTLPEPKTFSRYFNPRLPSATVTPTQLSKYNTFLQLLLVGGATLLPITPEWFQEASQTPWNMYMALVAITTVWSGLGYLGGGGSAKFLGNKAREVAAKRFKGSKQDKS